MTTQAQPQTQANTQPTTTGLLDTIVDESRVATNEQEKNHARDLITELKIKVE